MNHNIDKSTWHICKICGKTIKQLAKIYGGNGVYYTTVFRRHLTKDHFMFLEQYFQFLDRPICACGICNQPCDIGGIRSSKFYWKKYKCGRNLGQQQWSKNAKISRLGKNNPMYGKTPWNKGETKDTNESVKRISQKMTNRMVTEKTRHKQSISAKNRTIHGHTGHTHSEDTKEKLRQNTLKMIKEGRFKQTKTKPHKEMSKILDDLGIDYTEEYIVESWSFDFYIPIYDIYIEVDGDYFHSNPRKYPNGPQTKTQKINAYRDKKKNEFCHNKGLKLYRFWEYDVLNNREKVLCDLKKLFQLDM